MTEAETPFDVLDEGTPEIVNQVVGRQFLLWPKDIVVDHSLNSRWDDDRDTSELGAAMKEKGQKVAVGVRFEGDVPNLVFGYGRVKEATAAGTQVVCVEVDAKTRKDHLVLNLHENLKRTELHALDKAATVIKMSAVGMRNKDIAAEFGEDPGFVSTMKKLWKVSDDVKELIASGQMGYTTALDFVSWTPAKQKEVVRNLKEQLGMPAGVPLPDEMSSANNGGPRKKRASRKKVAKAAKAAGVSTPRMNRKSIADACAFWSEKVGKNSALPAAAKTFGKKVVQFYEGNLGEEDMLKVVVRAFGGSIKDLARRTAAKRSAK